MASHQKEPLRPLSSEEHAELTRVSRSESAPAGHVARARALLAVAAGQRFTDAARAAGRRGGAAATGWHSWWGGSIAWG